MNFKTIRHKISSQKSHWLRGFLIGLGISILVSTMAILGHFRSYENPFTAVLQQVLGKKSDDIVLLFLTEKEYKTGFKARSPLSRTRLAEIVNTLVRLEPRVIALDIDLSDDTDQDDDLIKAIRNAGSKNIPVVIPGIIKPVIDMDSDHGERADLHPYIPEIYSTTNDGFTLFHPPALKKDYLEIAYTGGSIFALDRDGVFRNASLFYYIDGNEEKKTAPSFPLAVATATMGLEKTDLYQALSERKNNNLVLPIQNNTKSYNIHYGAKARITPNFLGNYEHFERMIDIDALLETYKSDYQGVETIFKNKTVIIGGSYDRNDFYTTPVGRMSGMEIIANITQNILDHNLISHLSFWKAFALEVLFGAFVALIFILFSPMKAIIYCFISLAPLIVFGSLIAFSATYYWFDFIPTIAGVMLHGLISKIEANFHHKS